MVSTPLLLKKVVFEGMLLGPIPILKMEDWDLADHEKFLQLVSNKYLDKIYYEETEVTWLEPMKWVVGVDKVRLLNILWVSHFNRMIINTVCVRKFLALAHDGCIWLGEPIPITDI